MNTYTPFDGTILVPVQTVQLKFAEKEDMSLNPFQNLILEAIEEGCTVEQIAQATLLDKRVIETEVAQLITQKLLERQGEVIRLSALSERLLLVSRCVQRLNKEKRLVCINLVTGAVEEYNPEQLVKKRDGDELEFRPKIHRPEFEEISIGENLEFYQAYLRTFDNMEPEQIEAVLASVYIEYVYAGERGFRPQPVSRIPCLIGDEREETCAEASDLFWMGGYMCQVEFSLKPAAAGVDDSALPYLPPLADAGLLSEKGLTMAASVEAFQKAGPAAAWYDYASGRLQFDAPEYSGGQHAGRNTPLY